MIDEGYVPALIDPSHSLPSVVTETLVGPVLECSMPIQILNQTLR